MVVIPNCWPNLTFTSFPPSATVILIFSRTNGHFDGDDGGGRDGVVHLEASLRSDSRRFDEELRQSWLHGRGKTRMFRCSLWRRSINLWLLTVSLHAWLSFLLQSVDIHWFSRYIIFRCRTDGRTECRRRCTNFPSDRQRQRQYQLVRVRNASGGKSAVTDEWSFAFSKTKIWLTHMILKVTSELALAVFRNWHFKLLLKNWRSSSRCTTF